MKQKNQPSLSRLSRVLVLLIAMVVIMLGACAIIKGYAPGRFTRFGYMPPVYGTEAREYGVILILLGLMPLLAFCKTSRQIAIMGSILGTTLLAVIFITTYT